MTYYIHVIILLLDLHWHHDFYTYGKYLSYILFAVTLTGVLYIDPVYLSTLRVILKYYVCACIVIAF